MPTPTTGRTGSLWRPLWRRLRASWAGRGWPRPRGGDADAPEPYDSFLDEWDDTQPSEPAALQPPHPTHRI